MARHAAALHQKKPAGLLQMLSKLHSIKIGGGPDGPENLRIPKRDLSYLISNLAMLVGNGLALPSALATLEEEGTLSRHYELLNSLRRKIEAGESFSAALTYFPGVFNELMVHQIRVGERSGTMAHTLNRISSQLERSNELRAVIIKRLSYPGVVLVAGTCVVIFMLAFIIPVFQETYDKAKIPLPFITQSMIVGSDILLEYGWMMLLAAIATYIGWRKVRNRPAVAHWVDGTILKIPIVGDWFRDMAVHQFIQVLNTMMESGFKVSDALAISADSVHNAEVRGAVEDLKLAVNRGERLSHELERHDHLFPPIVSQLVIIGESTGKLAETTAQVEVHLQRQIEKKTDVIVGTIEPVLTIGMAVAIGIILLSIYLPMFDMINVVGTK